MTQLAIVNISNCDVAEAVQLIDTDVLEFSIRWKQSPGDCEGSLYLFDFLQCYRFTTAATNEVYFVLASRHRAKFFASYFPARGIIYANVDTPLESFVGMTTNQFHELFANHLDQYAHLLATYWDSNDKQLLMLSREMHMGHHLWNELSAVDKFTAKVGPPGVFAVLNAEKSEHFGRLEAIFPELDGRVIRPANDHDLAEFIYTNGFLAVRATHDFVSRRLGGRIVEVSRTEASKYQAAETHKALGLNRTVVVVAPRVENRTDIDVYDACERWVACLEEHTSSSFIVVVDGHNASTNGEGGYISYSEHLASASPETAEKSISLRLKQRFSESPNVVIVDNIGGSVSDSIYWVNQCRFFFAFWGAALAKLRWVCDRPGLVFTSKWNIEHRGDLGIYNHANFTDSETVMEYFPKEHVEDEPDAEMLLPLPYPHCFNFRINREAIAPIVSEFVSRQMA